MIGLYAAQLEPPRPTGVHRYVSELASALYALHPDRYRMLSDWEKHRAGWVPEGMPLTQLPRARRILHRTWHGRGRPRIELFSGSIDLLHILYPCFAVPSRAPLIQTIHDFHYLEVPENYESGAIEYAKGAFRQAAEKAAKIVTGAGVIAEQITERLGIEPSRIAVVYHGVAKGFRAPITNAEIAAACSLIGVEPGSYLIYVGSVEVKKNLTILVRALARRGPGARLVLAGRPGSGVAELAAEISALGLDDAVIMTGHVEESDLPRLMAGAVALVHPSRFEGFGLTPVEAMTVGIPVLGARGRVLEEVLGDTAELLDPDDADAWAGAMSRIEHDPDHAASLVEKGKRHAERFTWERAAAETAAVHDAVLDG